MTATLERPLAAALGDDRSWRERLQPLASPGGGWAATVLVTLLAGVLRFIRLDQPATALEAGGKVRVGYIFDEQYYACDAKSLVTYGVEHSTSSSGAFCSTTGDPAFVVHPPLGKWLIGLGEKLFGFTPFGWRFAAALFGTLTVLLVIRIGRRMTGSTLLGAFAGFLLALDGLHFVQSRVAMLDVFLCFWVVATFGALVVDRDQLRVRLAAAPDPASVRLGLRPWRLAAGVCAGAALATKWSGLFPLVVMVVLSVAWEVGARRAAGIPEQQPWRAWTGLALGVLAAAKGPHALHLGLAVGIGLLVAGSAWEWAVRRGGRVDGVPSFLRLALPVVVALAAVPVLVYTASWAGWFLTDSGWSRHWADGRSTSWGVFPDVVRSWWHYHSEMLNFHDNLDQSHPYQSHALSWPFLGRPVSYYYPPDVTVGRYGCAVVSCSREVLAIGTPALWWAMIPACLGLTARWVSRRDWRAASLLLLTAVSVLAWIPSDLHHRTMFLFYALPSVPFLCLGLALLAGWALEGGGLRRMWASATVGVYGSLVLLNFAYLYPVLAAVTIPYHSWLGRMWFRSWI